jgi:hypothetical protein
MNFAIFHALDFALRNPQLRWIDEIIAGIDEHHWHLNRLEL